MAVMSFYSSIVPIDRPLAGMLIANSGGDRFSVNEPYRVEAVIYKLNQSKHHTLWALREFRYANILGKD